MELQQLRYFVQVAKVESVSKAASLLHVSQPALSKSIIKLEHELGCALFDRTGKRLALNDKGRCFLRAVEQCLRELGEAVSVVAADDDDTERTLTVGVFGSQDSAIECVQRFMELNPRVNVTFDARRQTVTDHIAREFDALFYPDTEAFARVSGVAYAYDQLMLLVSAGHRLAGRASVDLAECRNEPFIFSNTTAGSYEEGYQRCLDSGFAPHVRVVATSGAARSRFVEAGLGVTFATSPTRVSGSQSSTLVALDGEKSSQALMFACAPERMLSPTAQAFRDFALGFFGVPIDKRTLDLFERN